MSDTIIDMPKVTQMLDAGWRIKMFKNQLGSYTAYAFRGGGNESFQYNLTDDFTPEQALTRLAYKVVDRIVI